MDLNGLDTELRSLREVPTPPRPAVEALAARAYRRRKRQRILGVTLASVVVVVAASVGFRAATGDDRVSVSSAGTEDDVEPKAPAGTVVVPDLTGQTLAMAVSTATSLGLSLTVSDGDIAVADAVVIATEPGEGVPVSSGAIIGARTALPDPPVGVECPYSRHPRGEVAADALPWSESLSRAAAEATVLALRAQTPESSGTEVYLGIWDRWAYTDDEGLNVVPTTGYQVIVVSREPANCPSAPSFQTVPITVVVGDVTAWAGDLIGTAPAIRVTGIEVHADANGGERVEFVLDGPAPNRQVTYVDEIPAQLTGVAYTAQQDPSAVQVCDSVHSFPSPSIGTIDVFIPRQWFDPSKPIEQITPRFDPESVDRPGKIVACGPYKGFVQYSIWAPTTTDPARLGAHLSDSAERIVIEIGS